jgi:hypothetical protein
LRGTNKHIYIHKYGQTDRQTERDKKVLKTLRVREGETERQRDRETERQRDRETERQRDRETERQRDRETERQRDRETERQKERMTNKADNVKSFKGRFTILTFMTLSIKTLAITFNITTISDSA